MNASPQHGLLLVNLGTPEAPTPEAVRAYLSEFLMDARVVQIPRLVWWPLLHGVILPRRSAPVAHKYASIWMEGGSPLAVYTRQLAEQTHTQLPQWKVAHAMRYGTPSIATAAEGMLAQGITKLTVLPLYPQYSTTTTASVEDAVARVQRAHPQLRIHMVRDYHAHPAWVQAVAASITQHWAAHGRGERLVLSFHGIPARLVRTGDPYAQQCEASTAAIALALGVARSEVMLTYQSRFGRERWLEPYTQSTLEALARDGVRRVDVACPGFAVDCLETLEEIAVENALAFKACGGEALCYIPCLNDSLGHAHALAAIALGENSAP